jgi:hypothetical protein
MKRALRFMVAKYVPDLHRMEPRNIGVILWADSGATVAKFIGEQEDGSLRVPALIEKTDRHAFREWRTYWRHQMASDGIRRRSGEIVPRSSPVFLEALREKSKEQFRLVDGGTFAETIAEREMERALGELYDKIVERPESQLVRAEKLELGDACKKLFESSGIAAREDLKHDLPVPRKVHGVTRTFTADFALGPTGHPSAILQRVLLLRDQSIDSNTLMFEAVLSGTHVPICAALVNLNQPLDRSAREGVKVLGKLAQVIDVSKASALKEMKSIELRAAPTGLI